MLDEKTTLVRSDDVLDTQLAETTILVYIEDNRYFELNDTGSKIWALLENKLNVSDIYQSFEADNIHIDTQEKEQINHYLQSLIDIKLITIL